MHDGRAQAPDAWADIIDAEDPLGVRSRGEGGADDLFRQRREEAAAGQEDAEENVQRFAVHCHRE